MQIKLMLKEQGFGLYIVKKIIEAHNGKVWAESDGEGKGAEFYVELNSKNLPCSQLVVVLGQENKNWSPYFCYRRDMATLWNYY